MFRMIKDNAALLLIALMFGGASALALGLHIPVRTVMSGYSYDVLVILLTMELFTNLIAETGIMQYLAVRIARWSQGSKCICLALFGGMMFLISSCLNNITAVMMILPVVFVLLKTLEVDRRYVCIFFGAILALSNLGGAASPIGDFPAIIIMTSGITTFLGYLTHAFPLFAGTALVVLLFWTKKASGVKFRVSDALVDLLYEAGEEDPDSADSEEARRAEEERALRSLAIANLMSQYKHIRVRWDVLRWLGAVFVSMFLAWSFVPQDVLPPEIIAVLGYAVGMVICSVKRVHVKQTVDLRSALTIASFLFFAQVVSRTGILDLAAAYLQQNITDPKLLVLVIMLITSLAAGIFSAGPAAAAMMPIIVEICHGPLSAHADWIAVAYAAAICAGSSLFMWSATAGFILSDKVNSACIPDTAADPAASSGDANDPAAPDANTNTNTNASAPGIRWGIPQYLKFGLTNYLIQILIALAAMACIL